MVQLAKGFILVAPLHPAPLEPMARNSQAGRKLDCAKCNAAPRRATHRYCTTCHAAYQREWSKAHPLQGDAKRRASARRYAGVYKRRGKLIPQACEIPGCSEPTQMHHDDYNKPLQVRWFCRDHHLHTLHADIYPQA